MKPKQTTQDPEDSQSLKQEGILLQDILNKNQLILLALAFIVLVIMGFITWQFLSFNSQSPQSQSTTIEQTESENSNILNDIYGASTLYDYRDLRTGISFKYPKGIHVKADYSINGSFGGATVRIEGARRQIAAKLTLRATEPGVFETAFETGDYKSAISQLRGLSYEGNEAENISPSEIAGLRSIEYRIKGKRWEDYTGYYKKIFIETSSSTFLVMEHYLEPQCEDCQKEVLYEVQKIIEDTLERSYKVEVVSDSMMETVIEEARQRGVQVADEIQPAYAYTSLSHVPKTYAYLLPVTEHYIFTVRGYRDGLVNAIFEGLSPGPKVVEIMYVLKPNGELVMAHEISGNVDECRPWDSSPNCSTDYECGCKRYFDVRSAGLNFSPNEKYVAYAVGETSGYMVDKSLFLYDIINSNLFPIPYITEAGIETRFGMNDIYWVPNEDDFDLVIIGRYDISGYAVGAGGYSGIFRSNNNSRELELVYTYGDGYKNNFDPSVTKIENKSLWFEQADQQYRMDVETGLVEKIDE